MGRAKFGVFLPSYSFQNQSTPPHQLFNQIRRVVLESERLGYDSIWLDDHMMLGTSPVLECWTTLSALASTTTRIRLGTMVTNAALRNPALLAKMAATVDVISNGRLEFGVGAGIQKQEHLAYGYPFPDASERINSMKEAIEIIKKMWTQPKTTYHRKHFTVENAVCTPKPLQKPNPPITVGGCGEKMLHATAQLADRFDFGYLPTTETYKAKLRTLEAHCKAIGRNFDEIKKSCWPAGQIVLGENKKSLEEKMEQLKPKGMRREDFEKFSFVGSPAEFAEAMKPYKELGVENFMLFFGDLPDLSSLTLFADFIKDNS